MGSTSEFQINRAKQDEQQKALSKHLNLDRGYEMLSIVFKLQQNRLSNGLYIVNPSGMEWLAATSRMSQHIESNELSSKGIQKHQMDHLIYSVARNLLGTICTDNEKDFLNITQIGSQRLHDGTIEIISLDDLVAKVQ